MAEFAPGLPDPKRFGNIRDLPVGKELMYVIQKHLAQRAGPHYDIRFGPDQGRKPTLLSWASRKLPEEPGSKVLAFQQPLHTGAYAGFEGEITSGYGKGTVKTHDKGAIVATKVEPNKINFAVIHKKHPETFTMIRKGGPPTGGSPRTQQTQGGSWLMINTTPTDVIEHKKVKYAKVPAEDVEKLFDEKYLHMEKIDGAAALYKLFSDKIEVLSYRPTTAGRPIVHTYRVGGTTGLNIPKHLVGSILRGELYGTRDDRAIPPQELGGILNSSTVKALKKQREQKVQLRNAVFNVLKYGKKPVGMDIPVAERLDKVREILKHLPKGKFHLPRMAETPEEQRALWEDVKGGRDPLTHEGIVAWPKKGGKPTKVKLYDEHDVHVKSIFLGEKRLEGVGAGGFEYSLSPEGPIAGKVGTGFSEELRRSMLEDPDQYIGRLARVKAQEKFPSGALRAPGLIAFHEDYPIMKKGAGWSLARTKGTPAADAFWQHVNTLKQPPTDKDEILRKLVAALVAEEEYEEMPPEEAQWAEQDALASILDKLSDPQIYATPPTTQATKKAASVDWSQVHDAAGLFKHAFFDYDPFSEEAKKPAWMMPRKAPTVKPRWMQQQQAPANTGLGWRESILGALLGIKPQAVRDTSSVLGGLSGIMDFFRNLGSLSFKQPGLPEEGDPFGARYR